MTVISWLLLITPLMLTASPPRCDCPLPKALLCDQSQVVKLLDQSDLGLYDHDRTCGDQRREDRESAMPSLAVVSVTGPCICVHAACRQCAAHHIVHLTKSYNYVEQIHLL